MARSLSDHRTVTTSGPMRISLAACNGDPRVLLRRVVNRDYCNWIPRLPYCLPRLVSGRCCSMSKRKVESDLVQTSREMGRISTIRLLAGLVVALIVGAVVLYWVVAREGADRLVESVVGCPPLRAGTDNASADLY